MDDPTADFLAREQAILGADAAMFETLDVNNEFNDFVAPVSSVDPVEFGDALVDPGAGFNPRDLANPMGNNDLFNADALESSNKQPFLATESSPIQFQQQPEIIQQEQKPSEAMIKWQQEFEAIVSERDLKEAEKHARILQEAQHNLEQFYAEYNEQKEKTIQKNKNLEKSLNSTRAEKLKGNAWVNFVNRNAFIR